jgi:uncharacterized SAM-binding protein YcdF (DUF218 family)
VESVDYWEEFRPPADAFGVCATRLPDIDPILALRAVAKALVLPPLGPLLVALVGLGLLHRRPRLGRALAWSGVLLLYALSTPLVAHLLLRGLAIPPMLDPESARSAQAIVILGGGVRQDAVEYGGDTLNRLTLERVRYGAKVARETRLPILVSGGTLDGGPTEAKLMKDALEGEFGVPVRWAESVSRNTHQNAVESAAILRSEGISKVVLVAHSFDMQRAIAELRRAGIETVPAPTLLPGEDRLDYRDFIPSLSGLTTSYFALYELLANLVFEIGRATGAKSAESAAAIDPR